MPPMSRTIHVRPDSELARLIDEAGEFPLTLVKNGTRYKLTREPVGDEDPWASYDPERARAGIRKAAGAWSDLDTEQMKHELYKAREEGSRSSRSG